MAIMDDVIKEKVKPVEMLIVEDSLTQAEELRYILEQSDYEVYVAHDGAEALALIDRHKPRIVISDVVMPGMDGYELCGCIKGDRSLRDIFVILLTTLSEPKDVIKSLQCGADKFFTKPYDKELLLSTIEHLLHGTAMPDKGEYGRVVEVPYKGERYSIRSSFSQILNLLISTYEAAVKKNTELIKTQEDLRVLNSELEEKVRERTADLLARNEELHVMSRQLWQTAKLATMGELVAGIAHELNNPLATVNLRVEMLLSGAAPDDPMRRSLEVIEQEVERMGNLVANLLRFSRRNKGNVSTVDVCEEIDGTLELIHYHMRKRGIEVTWECPPGIPHVHVDRQLLRQLFLNLFTNSSDAMPDGGTLTVCVKLERREGKDAGPGLRDGSGEARNETPPVLSNGKTGDHSVKRVWFDDVMNTGQPQPAGGYHNAGPGTETFIVIEITDTGAGIPPEVMSRVMEPFFTTKPEGKGTGLGLSICQRIVKEHKGEFIVESEPGKGTRVSIKLPVAIGSGRFKPIENEGN